MYPSGGCQRSLSAGRDSAADQNVEANIRILNTPDMEIASADIRGRIAGGEDISQMLPAEVEAYIRSHHLYERG